MADAVLAIQGGFEFQAKFFWRKACTLYLPNSNVKQVAWEISDTPGFDDVAVFYDPGKLSEYGYTVKCEYFQVKFHVNHSSAFSCDALIDPAFIGATSESLLQKLQRNYQKSPSEYATAVYHIVNTWGLDRNDTLKTLLDNNGAIRLSQLFDGKSDDSKHGKIRKKWREHLGLGSDDDLLLIVRQLRIMHSASSGEGIDEDMNFALAGVGLQTLQSDKRTSPYPDLIKRLHQEKRNLLGREELKEILKQENLWVTTTTQDVRNVYRIGVRTFSRGTDTIEFETDEYLCLLHHFDNRYVLADELWQSDIVPALQRLSDKALAEGKPLVIHLDTHLSAAFAMGYFLDAKTGAEVGVIQKVRNGGRILLEPNGKPAPGENAAPLWKWSEETINVSSNDVVLCIGVTYDIFPRVKEYVLESLPKVSRILSATILPGPSGASIRDGNHIVAAIEELLTEFRANRKAGERMGSVHLFLAAPNAFSFFLGRYGKQLGRITLYEFDFDNLRTGTYVPSISLPFLNK